MRIRRWSARSTLRHPDLAVAEAGNDIPRNHRRLAPLLAERAALFFLRCAAKAFLFASAAIVL